MTPEKISFQSRAEEALAELKISNALSPVLESAGNYAKENRWLAAWALSVDESALDDSCALLQTDRIRLLICCVGNDVIAALVDLKAGRAFVEGPSVYRLASGPKKRRIVSDGLDDADLKKNGDEIVISGRLGGCLIEHRFVLLPEDDAIDETIVLRNESDASLENVEIAIGMTAPVLDASGRLYDSEKATRWTAVPFRRETLGLNGEYEEYSSEQIVKTRGWHRTACMNPSKIPCDEFGSEGWVCTKSGAALLVAKYSQDQMEYSILAPELTGDGSLVRLGGCGKFHGDPECLQTIDPGAAIAFGATRFQAVVGGWKEGYYAFREMMAARGHKTPDNFNPPVVWNELYDNPLWWNRGMRDPEKRSQFYRLEDMEAEAAKAKELGCECLYLDPGWDDPFASSIWDEKRLGPPNEFVKSIKDKYGVQTGVWVPLAAWPGDSKYPPEADRLDEDGNRIEGSTCSGSPDFQNSKVEQLIKLSAAGVSFYVIDGTKYTGPCFDKNHGHPVPYTREAHCRSYYDMMRRVKEEHPKVLIEHHDMKNGGTMLRNCPIYYLHGLPHSFDEVWGFEYMWRTMEDLLKGWAVSLYYYNLAYSLPIYLHIDLRHDNASGLIFWWFASTCRHLGVGGKHPDPAVWETHKRSMALYRELKEFYTQGVFYGIEENIHLHTLPERNSAVVNLFNLTGQEQYISREIELARYGMRPERLRMGPHVRQTSPERINVFRRMPPHSAEVIQLVPPLLS
jgi:hypothetical protein